MRGQGEVRGGLLGGSSWVPSPVGWSPDLAERVAGKRGREDSHQPLRPQQGELRAGQQRAGRLWGLGEVTAGDTWAPWLVGTGRWQGGFWDRGDMLGAEPTGQGRTQLWRTLDTSLTAAPASSSPAFLGGGQREPPRPLSSQPSMAPLHTLRESQTLFLAPRTVPCPSLPGAAPWPWPPCSPTHRAADTLASCNQARPIVASGPLH